MGAKDISPEVVEKLVAFVRNLASSSSASPIFRQAADLVALLPEPVDPDLIEARKLAGALNQGGSTEQWLSGKWDDGPAVQWHLAGIKRGRQLSQDQPS